MVTNSYKLAVIITFAFLQMAIVAILPKFFKLKKLLSIQLLLFTTFYYLKIDFDGPFWFKRVNHHDPKEVKDMRREFTELVFVIAVIFVLNCGNGKKADGKCPFSDKSSSKAQDES